MLTLLFSRKEMQISGEITSLKLKKKKKGRRVKPFMKTIIWAGLASSNGWQAKWYTEGYESK